MLAIVYEYYRSCVTSNNLKQCFECNKNSSLDVTSDRSNTVTVSGQLHYF